MKPPALNPAHQLVIIARLGEYCQFRGSIKHYERDPWNYMRNKLLQTEEPLSELKGELFAATKKGLREELRAGGMTEERYADYKVLFECLLSRGDFADLAIHLTSAGGPPQIDGVENILKSVQPIHLFLEERKPPAERSPSWERLVKGLERRLDLDRLGLILSRKPRNPKRKAPILRRVRKNVAEYCAVVHIPTSPSDTFTPFMLPRIEGLIAANLRFLNKYR